MKSIPISVRVSQDEAETLARLHVPGATTPSEKLRGLIAEAHRRQQKPADYAEAVYQAQQWLAPVLDSVNTAESRFEQYSDIVSLLREWLPDFLAQIRLAGTADEPGLSLDDLHTLERNIADRMFRLMERVLQLALISRCRCYDSELLIKRMDHLQQLAAVITQQQKGNKEML